MLAMLRSVHSRGGVWFAMAAFSAGRPNESQPMGCKHVVALHPHVARQRVADGVVAHVSHVQRAGGIRQHLQHVILLARGAGRLGAIEIGILRPALGPLLLDGLRIVAVGMRGGVIVGDIGLRGAGDETGIVLLGLGIYALQNS